MVSGPPSLTPLSAYLALNGEANCALVSAADSCIPFEHFESLVAILDGPKKS